MNQQPQTQQEPVISKQKQQEIKQKEFREYLSRTDVVLAMVKYLLSIKNSQELPENPLNALQDYFGEYKDDSQQDYENLQKKYADLETENEQLYQEIEQLKQEIINAKEQKRLEEEELERQRLEEENKKGSKKPGKK